MKTEIRVMCHRSSMSVVPYLIRRLLARIPIFAHFHAEHGFARNLDLGMRLVID